ncbi:hypothetical protein RND81_10G012700 [Saponaria officinalis]|uniref:Uncharacterized protein n=1 Tax=Saponaria officinalis TaxID=3572 RepID=A0AAW1HZF2_SAPOF
MFLKPFSLASVCAESSFPIGRLSANFLSGGKNIVPALPLNSNLSLERLREISTWVRSSEQNADESIRSFSFQLKPALLKRALLVLCDSEVNETGFAYIHVDEKGCVITVDTKEGCTGVLLLSPSRLMNFQCRKPSTEAQIVSLNTVYWSLAPVNDNNTITVFQVDGSDQLSFVFEKYVGIRGLSVNLHRCSNNIGKFPEIKCYRNSSLESHDLSRIFRQYARAAAQRHLRVAAKIGQNELDFLFMDEGNRISVTTMPG